ncbi:hypothetical protein GAY29_14200 [Azospirillum brasilense]|nr:hypothetical protein [Azospirillum brasilense]
METDPETMEDVGSRQGKAIGGQSGSARFCKLALHVIEKPAAPCIRSVHLTSPSGSTGAAAPWQAVVGRRHGLLILPHLYSKIDAGTCQRSPENFTAQSRRTKLVTRAHQLLV